MTSGPNTPGFLGYMIAFGIGFAVFALLTTPFADSHDVDAFDAVAAFAYVVVVSSLYLLGLPLLGIAVAVYAVLRAVREHAEQQTHVIAASVVSFALALALTPFTSGWGERALLLLALPASMAIGRAAVIPLVESRRRLAAQGRLTGSARW